MPTTSLDENESLNLKESFQLKGYKEEGRYTQKEPQMDHLNVFG